MLLLISKRYLDKIFDLLTPGEIDTARSLKMFWLQSHMPLNAKSRKPYYRYYFITVRSRNLIHFQCHLEGFTNSKPKTQILAMTPFYVLSPLDFHTFVILAYNFRTKLHGDLGPFFWYP